MNAAETFTFGVTGQSSQMRVLAGRPSSGTYALLRDSGSDLATPIDSGAVVVDTFSTTTTAACGYDQSDPSTILVASIANVQSKKRYLLSGAGQSEWVEVMKASTGQVVTRQKIAGTYPAGATLASTYVSAPIGSTFVSDVSKLSDLDSAWPDYRIKWTAVVGSETIIQYSYFDLVRAPVRHNVDIEDLNLRMPGLRDSIPSDYRIDNGASLIEAAWRVVEVDLNAVDLTVDAIHNGQVVDELLTLRCRLLLAEGGWRPLGIDAVQYYEMARDTYNRFFEKNFQVTGRVSLQASPSGDGGRVANAPIWVR